MLCADLVKEAVECCQIFVSPLRVEKISSLLQVPRLVERWRSAFAGIRVNLYTSAGQVNDARWTEGSDESEIYQSGRTGVWEQEKQKVKVLAAQRPISRNTELTTPLAVISSAW